MHVSCAAVEEVVAVLPAARDLIGTMVVDVRGDVRPACVKNHNIVIANHHHG